VGSTTLTAAGARAPRDTPSSSKRRVGRLDLGNFSFPKGLLFSNLHWDQNLKNF
jgi:hypothetical protein